MDEQAFAIESSSRARDTAAIGRLRGLLEATRLVRHEHDLPSLLDAIAQTITGSLGWQCAVVSTYREAWDDFEVTAVHGSDGARDALMGAVRDWPNWEPLLDPRFERRGAFFIPHGQFDWDSVDAHSYVPELERSEDPRAWHPEDALIVPLRHTDGHYVGMLSVDDPADGLRPSDEELDVLVAVAAHASIAIQSAKEAATNARHRAALEQLLRVSASLGETESLDLVLEAVCDAIRSALGFTKITVDLLDRQTGLMVPRAAAGWDAGEDNPSSPAERVRVLLAPEHEVEGCFLLTNEQVLELTGNPTPGYASKLNGRGPHAWNHHSLLVPLHDRDGELVGVIWVDEPEDRLLPARERLQSLRMFANQVSTALQSVAQLEELRFLAEHDPLTRLENRRAFIRRLAEETARADRYDSCFALVVCDLDGFKEVNDRHGHLAGDFALQRVADVMRDSIRATDGAYRLGGDEFGLILIAAGREDALATAERVAAGLDAADDDAHVGELRLSFGVAVYPHDHRTPEALFHAADAQMYESKRAAFRAARLG